MSGAEISCAACAWTWNGGRLLPFLLLLTGVSPTRLPVLLCVFFFIFDGAMWAKGSVHPPLLRVGCQWNHAYLTLSATFPRR